MLRKCILFFLLIAYGFSVFGCGSSSGDDPAPVVITSLSEVGTIETGDALDVAADGDYLYYIGWGDTAESFGIIDFSDPTNPIILSTLNAGVAYGLAFDGRYAYVETDFGGEGIFANTTVGVVDCLDPNNPVGIVENDLGTYSAFDMTLGGNYLYNFSGKIIGVYDVLTPADIAHVANLSAGSPGSSARYGKAVGNYLYYGNGSQLVIFDISNPAALTDATDPAGTLAITGGGYGVAVSGDTAFIAGDAGGTYYIHAVDVSDPTAPVLISSAETATFLNNEMRILDDYLLVVGVDEFAVIDISDPNAMKAVDSVALTNDGWGFDVSGKYAVVADVATRASFFRIIQLY